MVSSRKGARANPLLALRDKSGRGKFSVVIGGITDLVWGWPHFVSVFVTHNGHQRLFLAALKCSPPHRKVD
jgi:hypothetical protein